MSDGTLLGWAAASGGLTHAVVRGAGHLTALDQPYAALDLMERWVRHEPIDGERSGLRAAMALQATAPAQPCSARRAASPAAQTASTYDALDVLGTAASAPEGRGTSTPGWLWGGLAGALLGAALSQAASLAWAAWRRRGGAGSEEAMDAVYFGMHGTGPGVAFA